MVLGEEQGIDLRIQHIEEDLGLALVGQHATRGEIANWVARRLGVRVPQFIDAEKDRGAHRRVDNANLRIATGWKPQFPDFQSTLC